MHTVCSLGRNKMCILSIHWAGGGRACGLFPGQEEGVHAVCSLDGKRVCTESVHWAEGGFIQSGSAVCSFHPTSRLGDESSPSQQVSLPGLYSCTYVVNAVGLPMWVFWVFFLKICCISSQRFFLLISLFF